MYRYVIHEKMLPYLQLGWHIEIPLADDYHSQWGMTLSWLCECKCVEPQEDKMPNKHTVIPIQTNYAIDLNDTIKAADTMAKQFRGEDKYEAPLLNAREKTHGDYRVGACYIQQTKQLWHDCTNWPLLSYAQQETLDMIATKAGRILSGDRNALDHWEDIAGYAGLVAAQLKAMPAVHSEDEIPKGKNSGC